jgi:hypothetical protein
MIWSENMNAKMNAIAMTLLMIASALAGCTSGDPDGDDTSGIDMEILNEMIDDNLQDFINNTTIVVNNHYHNNTTVVNNYDETNNDFSNTTNVEGSFGGVSGFNGSGGHDLYLLDIQFNLSSLLDLEENDHRNNSITGQYWLTDFDTGNTYEDNVTIDCGVYYIVGSDDFNSWTHNSSLWEESYWVNSDWYGTGWSVYESLGYEGYNITMRDLYHNIAWNQDVRETCDEYYNQNDEFDDLLLFEIIIPEGTAMRVARRANGQDYDYQGYAWAHEDEDWTGSGYIGTGEMEWRYWFYPDGANHGQSAFNIGFEFETITGVIPYMWVGGNEETTLEIYVSNILIGYEYRLIAYFEMAPVLSIE